MSIIRFLARFFDSISGDTVYLKGTQVGAMNGHINEQAEIYLKINSQFPKKLADVLVDKLLK